MKTRVLLAGAFGGMVLLGLVALMLFAAYKIRTAAQEKRAIQEAELQKQREEYAKNALAAFRPPVQPSADDTRTFERVLSSLGQTLEQNDERKVINVFDLERFVQELVNRGILDQSPGGDSKSNRDEFARNLRSEGGIATLVASFTQFRGEKTTIQQLRWSADRKEVVVVASHLSTINQHWYKMRWWMINKGGATWKVYDFEEIDFGLRRSEAYALTVTDTSNPELERQSTEIQMVTENLRQATLAIVFQKDPDSAQETLEGTRAATLPPQLVSSQALVEGRIQLARGKNEAALERFEEAEKLHQGAPIVNRLRATTLAAVGRAEEALPLLRSYMLELGPGADEYVVEGTVYGHLNDHEKARDSFRKALDIQPSSFEAMNGLRRELDNTDKSELGKRLAQAPEPAQLYRELLDSAHRDGDEAGAAALVAGVRKANPRDMFVVRETLQSLIKAKKFDAAYREFEQFLKEAVSDENRTQILNTFLFAMLGADRLIEGYTRIPDRYGAQAFRLLADELEDDLLDSDPENIRPRATQLLQGLIEVHRKRVPDDPWLSFFEATLLQQAKEYEQAERKYAAGQALYLKTVKKPAGNQKDPSADRFRFRRVQCLYALKLGMKAYEEVGPPKETFRQLAYAYSNDKDTENLEDLIRIHRSALPDDPNVTYWTAEIFFTREKYREAADSFEKFIKMAGIENYEKNLGTEKCIRSYIRTNRMREAQWLLAAQGQTSIPVGLRVAVALAAGRSTQAEELLGELAENRGGYGFVYYDPDFARLIAEPRFAELKKKYPNPQPPRAGPTG
jgi:tetratricopeptide (TPR) repeat protein